MKKKIDAFGIWLHHLPPYFLQGIFKYGFSIYKDKIFIQNRMADIEFINLIDGMNEKQLDNLIGVFGNDGLLHFVWIRESPAKFRSKKVIKINGKSYQIVRSGRYWSRK